MNTKKILIILIMVSLSFCFVYGENNKNSNPKEYTKIEIHYVVNNDNLCSNVISINKIHYKVIAAKPVMLLNCLNDIDNERKPYCTVISNSELKFYFNKLQIQSIAIYDINGNIVNTYNVQNNSEYFICDINNLIKGPYFAKLNEIDNIIHILKFIR